MPLGKHGQVENCPFDTISPTCTLLFTPGPLLMLLSVPEGLRPLPRTNPLILGAFLTAPPTPGLPSLPTASWLKLVVLLHEGHP